MSSADAPVLIAALTAIVGLFSLLNAFGVALVTQRAERRAKAVEIYDEYYSPENYRRVVLPVFCIMLKWWHLPEPQRSDYRAVLRRGWIGFEADADSLLATYVGADYLGENPNHAHFHKVVPSEAFTEHESLTVFLYFWTKVYELLHADVVDQKTAQRLLAGPYSYLADFIKEYREDIAQHATSDDLPPWHHATQELDKLLLDTATSTPKSYTASPATKPLAQAH
ncbi:MAG: hypothetical protein K0U34_05840 [Alphaproteobacteria bacterium]|nr:hypothetical protein [Alphaproteobacteria bacterium]